MKPKQLLHLILLISLLGCAGNSLKQQNATEEKQFGLAIQNGPRQGFQYFDSTKTEYLYTYNTITITNDTTFPIQLEIGLPNLQKGLGDSCHSKVFLLPRHLTPKAQHFDATMPVGLKQFLDFDTNKAEHLSKKISPSEKCVLTFGLLTNTKCPNPTTAFGTKLLLSKENSETLSVQLKLNDTLVLPCGRILHLKN